MRKLNTEYFIIKHFKDSDEPITLRELQDELDNYNKSIRNSCRPGFGTYGEVYNFVQALSLWLKMDEYTISFVGDRESFKEYCKVYFKYSKPFYDDCE